MAAREAAAMPLPASGASLPGGWVGVGVEVRVGGVIEGVIEGVVRVDTKVEEKVVGE